MRVFVLQPATHLARKLQLGEFTAEELLRGRRRIEACELGGLDLVQRAALHELALHRVERSKLVMLLGERLRFALDAKKLGGEILDVRRQRDQELRLRGTRRRLRARSGKLVRQSAIGSGEVIDERAIEPDQALALVQVGEGDAEAKLHEVRIIGEFFRHYLIPQGSTPCKSRTASSSSPAAPRALAQRRRAWPPKTAARSSSPTCRWKRARSSRASWAAASRRPT